MSCSSSQPPQALPALLREHTERGGGGVGFDCAVDVDLLDQCVGRPGGDFQAERISSGVNVPCSRGVGDVCGARGDVFAGIGCQLRSVDLVLDCLSDSLGRGRGALHGA